MQVAEAFKRLQDVVVRLQGAERPWRDVATGAGGGSGA